jgi:hypothetical protein
MEEGIQPIVGCARRSRRMRDRTISIPIPSGERMSAPRIFDEMFDFADGKGDANKKGDGDNFDFARFGLGEIGSYSK